DFAFGLAIGEVAAVGEGFFRTHRIKSELVNAPVERFLPSFSGENKNVSIGDEHAVGDDVEDVLAVARRRRGGWVVFLEFAWRDGNGHMGDLDERDVLNRAEKANNADSEGEMIDVNEGRRARAA